MSEIRATLSNTAITVSLDAGEPYDLQKAMDETVTIEKTHGQLR